MRHGISAGLALTALLLSACGPAEVVVTAEIQVEDPLTGEATARAPVGPRDPAGPLRPERSVRLTHQVASTPEPPIPDQVLLAQEEIAEAQLTWREAENRWNTLRDTLQRLNTALNQYSRGEQRYITLFNEWQNLDGALGGVERQMEREFERFDSLSKANIQATEAARIERDNWADDAFAEVGLVFAAKEDGSGLEQVADTTNAAGVATFEARPGPYWVYARYEEPYTELYWNVPLEVARGEPIQFRLTRENADVRPKL